MPVGKIEKKTNLINTLFFEVGENNNLVCMRLFILNDSFFETAFYTKR